MRILILSNMYPSCEKPYAGIFVKNQVEILREKVGPDSSVTLKAMRRRFTGRLGTLTKYLLFFVRCMPNFFVRYDIVHIHYFVPLGLLGAIYKGCHPSCRLIVTFHGGDVNDSHFESWPGKIWRWASRKLDLGIAVGAGVAESVARHLDVSRIEIQPVGVDSRKFYPPGQAQSSKKYDLLFTGSFVHRKGLDIFLDALGDDRFGSTRVACVGTGPLRRLIESARKSRDIEILDDLSQDELRSVYWASKFLVLPSRSEPFGLVVSEALYCGIPAVVSNEPGPMAQVRHLENGYVVAKESIEELRETLLTALAMDGVAYENMAGKAARSNREFDIFSVTSTLVSEYQSLSEQ